MSKTTAELPIILFETVPEWDSWLEQNHTTTDGIWMRFAKKGSGQKSINYREAVEIALCHGWIDSQVKTFDAETYIQKFTPRRAKSMWSKINRDRVEMLIESGAMRPTGLAEIERAKADGRWDAAYDSPSKSTVPEDFQAELDRNSKAAAFFETISKSNRYAILFRIQTAKRAETRAKRIQELIRMLEDHEVIHP